MSSSRSLGTEITVHFWERPTACREIDMDEVSSHDFSPTQREK